MLMSVLSGPTEPNLNALAWKMASGNDWNAKISNQVNMCIFNEQWWWFFESIQSLAPANVHHKYEINYGNVSLYME